MPEEAKAFAAYQEVSQQDQKLARINTLEKSMRRQTSQSSEPAKHTKTDAKNFDSEELQAILDGLK